MKHSELSLIPVFVAVCEERNLSKAAARLRVSQPSVSNAISKLRGIYGDQLFYRNGSNGVEISKYAEDLYASMKCLLNCVDTNLAGIKSFDPNTSTRTFSIACLPYISYQLTLNLMNRIRDSAPNVYIEFTPLVVEKYEDELRSQKYDLVLDIDRQLGRSLKKESIFSEQLCVVCDENHPRIDGEISLPQFYEEEHIILSAGQGRKSVLPLNIIPELAKRKISYGAADYIELLALICGSEYLAIFPKTFAGKFSCKYNLKTFPAPFKKSIYDIYAVWHSNRTNDDGHHWLRKEIIDVAYNQLSDNTHQGVVTHVT